MIFDTVENLKEYSSFPYIVEIINFINNTNLHELKDGDISIKDDSLFVKVLRYTPQDPAKNYFETHEHYADLQMIVSGIEAFHVVEKSHLQPTEEFKMDGDFHFYKAKDNISALVLEEGKFILVFPEEAHKPGCMYNRIKEPILKLVFKIKMK
jgi:biofilm protein TabA